MLSSCSSSRRISAVTACQLIYDVSLWSIGEMREKSNSTRQVVHSEYLGFQSITVCKLPGRLKDNETWTVDRWRSYRQLRVEAKLMSCEGCKSVEWGTYSFFFKFELSPNFSQNFNGNGPKTVPKTYRKRLNYAVSAALLSRSGLYGQIRYNEPAYGNYFTEMI